MKKILLLVAAVFLVACEGLPVDEGIVKEEQYVVEDIQIIMKTDAFTAVMEKDTTKWDKVKVMTETETIVEDLKDTTFLKTNDDASTVNVKTTKFKDDSTARELNFHLNADGVKMISKQYADLYNRTYISI